jgi:hypothetical protein
MRDNPFRNPVPLRRVRVIVAARLRCLIGGDHRHAGRELVQIQLFSVGSRPEGIKDEEEQ